MDNPELFPADAAAAIGVDDPQYVPPQEPPAEFADGYLRVYMGPDHSVSAEDRDYNNQDWDQRLPGTASPAGPSDGEADFSAQSFPGSSFGPSSAEVLVGLNDQQKEAVVHEGAPLLIVAGAGSGKTRVLTHRIAYQLAEQNLRSGEILAITFTNKAAAEMRERVHSLVGPGRGHIWVSTFHSACVRILRQHASAADLKSNFSIYDAQDSQRLLGMILRDKGYDTKRFTPRFVSGRISDLKNELITPGEYAQSAPPDPVSQMVAEVYTEYNKRLKLANSLDFDDLIMVTVQMLQGHPAILESYHRRFKEILVDEYQDTNHAQYVLIHTLVGDGEDGVEPAQLTVVGDSDQSIYAFRGASIRNIEEFEQDFANARTVMLEQNYRSTQNILDAANGVISENVGRRPKKLWTALGGGEKVGVGAGDDEYDEARFVVGEIQTLLADGVDGGDIAIFYRTNAQSRVLEETLMSVPIPYRIVGGVRFYERAEIKDALAYLQAIVNPDDTVAVRRIINTPRRGIGDKAQAHIAAHADRYGISFGAALADSRADTDRPIDGLAVRARNSAAELWSVLEEMRAKDAAGVPPHEILEEILDTTGYLKTLRASDDPQDAVREDNLADLVASATEFAAQNAEGQTNLEAFLERTALVSDADQIPGEGQRAGEVTLMTVHTAKGLEFPYVFVTGLEDGTFPHRRSMDEEDDLAEERRLAYVALTRAQKKLFLSRAAARRSWGTTEHMPASRFLDNIPDDVTELLAEARSERYRREAGTDYQPAFWDSTWSAQPGDSRGSGSSSRTGGRRAHGAGRYGSGGHGSDSYVDDRFGDDQHVVGSGRGRRGGLQPLGQQKESAQATDGDSPLSLKTGDRVQHATLGEGVVIGLEGSGRSTVARVQFGDVTKRLLLRMAPLAKL